MTNLSLIPQLAHRCVLDLSRSPENLQTFVPRFFDRACPGICEDDQMKVLVLAYEVCWQRAEELRQELQHLASLLKEVRDPEIAARARGLKKLSDDYFQIFERIGAYLIHKQKKGVAQAQPH